MFDKMGENHPMFGKIYNPKTLKKLIQQLVKNFMYIDLWH